jgi:hypothetical protein
MYACMYCSDELISYLTEVRIYEIPARTMLGIVTLQLPPLPKWGVDSPRDSSFAISFTISRSDASTPSSSSQPIKT